MNMHRTATTFLYGLVLLSFLSLSLAKAEQTDMSPPVCVTGIDIENVAFPPSVKPPGSEKTLFLGGAGA